MPKLITVEGDVISKNLLSPVEEDASALAPVVQRAAFAGAKVTRLDSDLGDSAEVNRSLYQNLLVLRQRSRQLAMDDVYATKYFSLTKQETLGPKGLKLSVQGPDPKVNDIIEKLYKDWSRDCCTSGDMTLLDFEQLAVMSRHRDGEFFCRIVENFKNNEYRFAFFPFDPDRLELGFDHGPRQDGSYISNSIEYDKWGRPIAYHILERHPGDNVARWPDGQYRMRIPANEIIHYFEKFRPGQGRGIPSLHAAIVSAKHLNAYTKATIVAARVIASKFAAITSPETDPHKQNLGEVKEGEVINKVEAGRVFRLGPGEKLDVFDPKQPSGQFGPFLKAIIQGYASGTSGATYASLSGDLSGTSFASGRLGALEIQDYWSLQRTNFNTRVKLKAYEKWLYWAWLTHEELFNVVKSPEALKVYAKSAVVYDKPTVWIDPEATSKVIERNLATGLTTLRKELAKLNIDYDDHIKELQKEKKDLQGLLPEGKDEKEQKRLEVVTSKSASK